MLVQGKFSISEMLLLCVTLMVWTISADRLEGKKPKETRSNLQSTLCKYQVPFRAPIKSLERQPAGVTLFPMSKEGHRRQRTGEAHYQAMHTQMQEKDSAFQWGPKIAKHALDKKATHALDKKEQSCRQQGVLCSTAHMQRGAQKISVANLVRADEKENLREKHRHLVVFLTNCLDPHFLASCPTPRSTS